MDARYSLEQIFVSPGSSGEDHKKTSEALLALLKSGTPADTLGNRTLLPFQMHSATTAQIVSTYGQEFAEAVDRLPVGGWQKDVRSSFGYHIVRVTEKRDPVLPVTWRYSKYCRT